MPCIQNSYKVSLLALYDIKYTYPLDMKTEKKEEKKIPYKQCGMINSCLSASCFSRVNNFFSIFFCFPVKSGESLGEIFLSLFFFLSFCYYLYVTVYRLYNKNNATEKNV